jgi:ubiquinone/menaquinone biosynthesis C-methylase UbiE
MFDKIASVYDIAKQHRNYVGEALALSRIIKEHKPRATRLLEVACGTGNFIQAIQNLGYKCDGIDISSEMLREARRKLSNTATLALADMRSFTTYNTYDAVLCIDGAIGYVRFEDLEAMLSCADRCLNETGIIIIEPWFSQETWKPINHVVQHKSGDITLVRMGHGLDDGTIIFHNLVGDSQGIKHFVETYKFWLHDNATIVNQLKNLCFKVTFLEYEEHFKRGLIVATK